MRQYEDDLYQKGVKVIAGVDEVGRGPLIGPVVAACVVLGKDFYLEGLDDSKKLTSKQREKFNQYIINNCLAYAIEEVSVKEIDTINIYQASKKAIEKSVKKVNKKIKIDHVLVDAMPISLKIKSTSIIKGDQKSISIAAASVVAKVYRDNLMIKMSRKYPNYQLEKNKGYPTKYHLVMIKKHGIVNQHRKSFKPVKEVLDENKTISGRTT